MASFSANEFVDCAACGDLTAIKDMLNDASLPASLFNAVDKDGRSAFHYSCLNDDIPLLTVLLADSRVDPLLTSPKGDTGMHMGALYASLEALKMLFADGRVNVNSQNQYGETPLHLCAGSGDKGAAKAAKLLMDNGALMTITDKWNRGPLDVSRDNAENPLVQVFNEYLESHPEEKVKVDAVTKAYKAGDEEFHTEQNKARLGAKNAIFGALGSTAQGGGLPGGGGAGGGLLGGIAGLKLKKTTVVEKKMFASQTSDSQVGLYECSTHVMIVG
jgi:hypothetical protein